MIDRLLDMKACTLARMINIATISLPTLQVSVHTLYIIFTNKHIIHITKHI